MDASVTHQTIHHLCKPVGGRRQICFQLGGIDSFVRGVINQPIMILYYHYREIKPEITLRKASVLATVALTRTKRHCILADWSGGRPDARCNPSLAHWHAHKWSRQAALVVNLEFYTFMFDTESC